MGTPTWQTALHKQAGFTGSRFATVHCPNTSACYEEVSLASSPIWEPSDQERMSAERGPGVRPAPTSTTLLTYSSRKGIRMQEQSTARRGGAAVIWKWGAISG